MLPSAFLVCLYALSQCTAGPTHSFEERVMRDEKCKIRDGLQLHALSIIYCASRMSALLSCIDLSDGNRKFLSILNFIDPAVANPYHLIGDIEHLKIVGG